MSPPRTASKTNALTRGSNVYAIATPANVGTRGFVLLVEGDDSTAQSLGEELRSLVQETCRVGSDIETLFQSVKKKKEENQSLSLTLAIRTLDEVWLLSIGGTRIFRWSSADSLAALSPKRESSRSIKWFNPRKPISISRLDRIMVSSEALSLVIDEHQLLYLHSNEVASLMDSQGAQSFGAAWSGAEHKDTEWLETRETPPTSTTTSSKRNTRAVRWLIASGLVLCLLIGVLIGTQFFDDDITFGEKEASILAWEAQPSLETSKADTSPTTAADEKNPGVFDTPATLAGEQKPKDPLDEMVLGETQTALQARTFLLGEYRQVLLENPPPKQLPPAHMLPPVQKPFFMTEGSPPADVLARRAEALIRQSVMLAKYEKLQDLEGQVTFRAKDPHVRGWLTQLRALTTSEVLKKWAELHLEGNAGGSP